MKRVVENAQCASCALRAQWRASPALVGCYQHATLRGDEADEQARVYVDEFRTSRLCSECFTPMVGMPFAVPDADKVEPSRSARLCRNILCDATCWERDVNAAKNMWQLGLLQVTGRPRTWQFLRGRRL